MNYKKKPDGIFWNKEKQRTYVHKGYSTSIFWSKQMIDDIKRYYPTTKNEELAGMLGVSQSTLIRKARELGLDKDREWLLGIWEERRMIAHAISKKKGYPGTFQKGNMIGAEYRFKKKV